MSKTKIVIALAAIAALTLVIVGLASAELAASQTYAGSIPNSSNGGLFGWMGRCFGFGNSQPYGNQNVSPQVPPISSSVPAPNQGVNSYGNGYGRCIGGW